VQVGIMGGTFDPIHMGHLMAGERARVEAGLDEVWFMPSNVPPHKKNAPLATAEQRWEMVCRALEGNRYFRPTDIEIRKGGISYSIDTIEMLIALHSTHTFSYIIGADMVQYLPKWHRIDELVQHIRFIGLGRPGYELHLERLPSHIRERVRVITMPLIEISATGIREECGRNGSIRYWVPDSVHDYIEVNRLYES
jgi:nicotinate-nucleotide adenylyltransferase